MTWLLDLKLIRFFDFYLAVTFVASTALRARQYGAVVKLVRTFGGRWPLLLKLVTQHRQIFLTRGTVLPLIASLGMLFLQTLASRLIWPQAHLSFDQLRGSWIALLAVSVLGIGMVAFDLWGILVVGEVNNAELEKYFDQAEKWLRRAPMLQIFTAGLFRPREIVAKEVKAALLSASDMLNYNLKWVAVQAAIRLLFGLSLWVSWAFLG